MFLLSYVVFKLIWTFISLSWDAVYLYKSVFLCQTKILV